MTSLIFRRKLCFVIRKANGKTIAYRTFYFNEDDIRRGTVHDSFRYVVKEERRKGYGNLLVETTEQYFENHTSIKGFTSKVLESNIASAKSILKQGYRIISWDNNAEGERINYYLKFMSILSNKEIYRNLCKQKKQSKFYSRLRLDAVCGADN